jgi:hypothetical protein
MNRIFNEKLFVFPFEDHAHFAVLQSRIHEPWTRLLSSTLEDRLNYSASDCFETFPFPPADQLTPAGALEAIGQRLYEDRAAFMTAEGKGLTVLYNLLKDPACDDERIVALRRLHEDMDRAVLSAYGWSEIPVPPYETPKEDPALEAFQDEVIDRLFALNALRAAEEKKAAPPPKAPRRQTPPPSSSPAPLELTSPPAPTEAKTPRPRRPKKPE